MTVWKKSRVCRLTRLWLGGSAFCALASVASAQDAPSTEPETSAGEEVVVTGQKMGNQSILDVPISMKAFGATELNDAGISDLSEIVALSPSVEMAETGGRAFNFLSIRGVSSTEGGTPTVQVCVDGFTTGIARGQISTTLFDLQRVEILKGPQATLYGRNAIGGVINYITKKPSEEFEASLNFALGAYGTAEATGRVSGAIADGWLFGEIAVSHRSRDGYFDNVSTGEDGMDSQEDTAVRGALRAVAGPTTVDFSLTFSDSTDGCTDCSYIPRDYTIPLPIGLPPFDTSIRDGLVDLNSYDRYFDQDTPLHFLKRRSETAILTIEHEFGGATLTAISGYGHVESDMAYDLDRAAGRNPIPAFNTFARGIYDDRSYSQEVRLAGGGDGELRWLAGVYYSRLEQKSDAFIAGIFPAIDQNSESENLAFFLNAELPIGNFVLGGGLRYDREETEQTNRLLPLTVKSSSEEVLPRLTLAYHFESGLMAYATMSKGYKTGGANVDALDPSVPRTYAPEYLWNYEAGLKGRILNDALTFSVSVCYMDWTDRQVQLLDPSGLYVYQDNLGKASISGLELELDAQLGEHLTLTGSITWLNGEIDEYLDLSGVSTYYGVDPNLAGNDLPNAPSFRAVLSLQYLAPLPSSTYELRARADVAYTGERYFDAQNLLRQDPYTLVNLYVGIESESLAFGLFADNVFDEGYHSSGLLVTIGPLLTTGKPRVIGVRGRVGF